MKEWRSDTNKALRRRSIMKHEWPRLVSAMMEDGLHAQITEEGIVFSIKQYVLTPFNVKKAWSLSDGQFNKLRSYINANDPWGRTPKGFE